MPEAHRQHSTPQALDNYILGEGSGTEQSKGTVICLHNTIAFVLVHFLYIENGGC